MGEKFCFVRRHVHIYRAIAFAPFAREAQIERFFYPLVAPSVLNHVALQHFPQRMRAPARRIAFFPRDHKTGAHGVLLTASRETSALAYSYTAERRACETPVVFGKLEVCLRLPGFVLRAEPKILVHTMSVNYF